MAIYDVLEIHDDEIQLKKMKFFINVQKKKIITKRQKDKIRKNQTSDQDQSQRDSAEKTTSL